MYTRQHTDNTQDIQAIKTLFLAVRVVSGVFIPVLLIIVSFILLAYTLCYPVISANVAYTATLYSAILLCVLIVVYSVSSSCSQMIDE